MSMKVMKADDHRCDHSDASDGSTASGISGVSGRASDLLTPSKMLRAKPQELLSASTHAESLSPVGCRDGRAFDAESLPSPSSWVSLGAVLEEAGKELQGLPPPAPKYPAPPVTGLEHGPQAPSQAPSARSLPPALSPLHSGALSPSLVGSLSPMSPDAPGNGRLELFTSWIPEPPTGPPSMPASPHLPHLPPAPWPKTAPPSAAPSVASAPRAWPPAPGGLQPPGLQPPGLQAPSHHGPAHGSAHGADPLRSAIPDASQRMPARPMLGPGLSFDPALHNIPRSPTGAILSVPAPLSPQGQHFPPLLPHVQSQPPAFYPPPAFAHFAPELAPRGQAAAIGRWNARPTEDENLELEVQRMLSMLIALRSTSSGPPLPPSGCYGLLHVSSALCNGLGPEAAEAAEAAAKELGERPVKVLLPWYPAYSPGIAMFDQTKPAKVPIHSR